VMLPMDYVNYCAFDERPARAMELLRRVGLEAHAYKHPDAVSTGQQQAAAIARALATDPPVLVADEPTGNLDSRSADVVIGLFTELVRAGKTIAMVTHDPSLTTRVDRTIVIADGELVDETLARALPWLPHRQMLAATRQLQRRTLPAGAVLLAPGETPEYVWMIAAGAAEEVDGAGRVTAERGPGDLIGAREPHSPASRLVRAGAAPLEVLALERAVFVSLLAEAPAARAALAGERGA
ncbi:MAG: ATP-binding cassette domain-containing protein, partial [Anaerolineales bacterium]|nr:ATP-binding cassette domain-containing protein [Anaerolineales bacterium]